MNLVKLDSIINEKTNDKEKRKELNADKRRWGRIYTDKKIFTTEYTECTEKRSLRLKKRLKKEISTNWANYTNYAN